MVTAAWDTSNLVALYKDGKQCVTCCTPPGGWSPDDIACFLDPGETVLGCESADWDQYPPFGGPGKSPGSYTLTLVGVQGCPGWGFTVQDINGVHHLAVIACGFQEDGCFLLDVVIGGRNTRFSLELCSSSGAVFGLVIHDIATGLVIFRHYLNDDGQCRIAVDNFSNDWAACGAFNAGMSGTVSWRPGTILAWNSGTGYVSGDIVAHEGVFYKCIVDHTDREPPNATYWQLF